MKKIAILLFGLFVAGVAAYGLPTDLKDQPVEKIQKVFEIGDDNQVVIEQVAPVVFQMDYAVLAQFSVDLELIAEKFEYVVMDEGKPIAGYRRWCNPILINDSKITYQPKRLLNKSLHQRHQPRVREIDKIDVGVSGRMHYLIE